MLKVISWNQTTCLICCLFLVLSLLLNRLIPAIAMAIIFKFIMLIGFSVRVNSLSSTGKISWVQKKILQIDFCLTLMNIISALLIFGLRKIQARYRRRKRSKS